MYVARVFKLCSLRGNIETIQVEDDVAMGAEASGLLYRCHRGHLEFEPRLFEYALREFEYGGGGDV